MDLGDFLVQIPSGLIVMVCGSGLLFVVSVLIIAQRHNRRRIARSAPMMEAIPAPDAEIAAVPAEAEATQAAPGLPSRAWRAIHDFFFYSEEERAERERAKAQAATQSAAQADPPAPRFSPPPDSAEILHLWRDVVDGDLIIQIGDDYFRTMGDIAAAGQERRFMAVLRELARIAKETVGEVTTLRPAPPVAAAWEAAAEEAAKVAAPTSEDSAVEQPAVADPPAAEEPSAADGPAALEDPRPEPPPAPEVAAMIKAAQRNTARPSLTSDVHQSPSTAPEPEPLGSFFDNVRNAVRRGGKAPAKGPEVPTLSIADEIEELLQNRLRSAPPELQSRRIHVRPAMDGGVRIEVDGRFFEAVGDIEDEDVRGYVIDTIQAWEASR